MRILDWSQTGRHTFMVGGVSLEFETMGPAPHSSVTLVMLHEGLGCVRMWRDFPTRLGDATGLGVMSYSRQGYGQSDPCDLPRPIDYMEREARDVLTQVLDAAGVERAVLIGHSDGASIAALHQREVSDPRILGLVLMAPHFFVEDLSIESIENARVAWRETDLKNRLAKYHDNVEAAFLGWNQAWLDPEFRDWNITDSISSFRVPTLAIQGKLDEYGTARQVEIISELSPAPVTTTMLEDCGHSPFRDKPEETIREISEFVDGLAGVSQSPK